MLTCKNKRASHRLIRPKALHIPVRRATLDHLLVLLVASMARLAVALRQRLPRRHSRWLHIASC